LRRPLPQRVTSEQPVRRHRSTLSPSTPRTRIALIARREVSGQPFGARHGHSVLDATVYPAGRDHAQRFNSLYRFFSSYR
jgi:hypothetical protein